MKLHDFDSSMLILTAITEITDAGKAKLADFTADVACDGRTWVDAYAGTRGNRSTVRKLLRDGLLSENARRQDEIELTDLGRAVAKATADEGNALATLNADYSLEASRGC